MPIIFYQSMSIFAITVLLAAAVSSLSKKTFSDREKNSPFECGFEPKNSARLPFSLHFFMLALIFIIFDVELAILLPSIVITENSSVSPYFIMINIFIFILLIGLYHEKHQGSLDWSK